MPANLTDSDAFTAPVVVPVDTEAATAASLVQFAQPLANRTRWLKNKIETGGVSAIRIGSVATMKALTAQVAPSVFVVNDGNELDGLYFYCSTAGGTLGSATPDDRFVHAATGMADGNWVHSDYSLLNIAKGIAKIDAAGKILSGIVPYGVVGTPQVRNASSVGWGVNSTASLTDVPVLGAAFTTTANTLAGDVIVCHLTASARAPTHGFYVDTYVSENGGGDIRVSPEPVQAFAGDDRAHCPALSFTRVVASPGTFEVKIKFRTENAASTVVVRMGTGFLLHMRA